MALVLVTHNMGVVAEMARRVAVMYAGQVVEEQRRRGAVRGAPAPVYRGAAGGDARAQRRATRAWRRSPAWCRASTTGRRAACSRRAAPMRPTTAAGCARSCGLAGRPGALPLPAGRSRPRRGDRARRPAGRCRRERPAAPRASPHRALRGHRAAARRERRGEGAVVRATDLTRIYAIRRGLFRAAGAAAGGGRRLVRDRGGHARWRWSANRAAASRRWRAWCR